MRCRHAAHIEECAACWLSMAADVLCGTLPLLPLMRAGAVGVHWLDAALDRIADFLDERI